MCKYTYYLSYLLTYYKKQCISWGSWTLLIFIIFLIHALCIAQMFAKPKVNEMPNKLLNERIKFGMTKSVQKINTIQHRIEYYYGYFSCVFGRECLLWSVSSLGKTVNLCPASFYTPGTNLPVTPACHLLTSFRIPAPCDAKDIFWGC